MTNKNFKKVFTFLVKINNIDNMQIFKNKFMQNIKKFDSNQKNIIINLYNDKIELLQKCVKCGCPEAEYKKFIKSSKNEL